MFSNLRTEGNTSNHLVFKERIDLFNYQQSLVQIVNSNDKKLNRVKDENLRIIEMQFFDYIARNPNISVTYIKDNELITSFSRSDEEINRWKLPYLAYKLMVWQFVPAEGKMPCYTFYR